MATPQNIPKGTTLFRAGDPCPGFVVLSEGTIRVTMSAANGREVVLYRVRPGDVCLQTFSCLIDGRSSSAEGVAETDLSAESLGQLAAFGLVHSLHEGVVALLCAQVVGLRWVQRNVLVLHF